MTDSEAVEELVEEEEPLLPEPEPEAEPEPELVSVPVETQPKVEVRRRHPSADPNEPFPLAEPGEYYIGLWSGLPNYGCPYCPYATLDGPGQVELHILAMVDAGNPRHMKALELK